MINTIVAVGANALVAAVGIAALAFVLRAGRPPTR